MHIGRTRIKQEIVCEYLLPQKKTRRVIILVPGMPGYPKQDALMLFLAKEGYAVFLPRYRGTFESSGAFLKDDPTKDILDIIQALKTGWYDAWSKEKHHIKNPLVFVIGSSFGGPAAIFSSVHTSVSKVIALSPVVDWRVDSEIEPMDKLAHFVTVGFGMGYRFTKKNWDKLSGGTFYNPIENLPCVHGKKILIFHGTKDPIVPFAPTKVFAEKTRSTLIPIRTHDHLGLSRIRKKPYWSKIKKFLNS